MKKFWSVFCLLLLPTALLSAQDLLDRTADVLAGCGFSNVRVADKDSALILTIQNDAYKLQASGIAAAIDVLDSQGLLESGKDVHVIVTDYGVPQITLNYVPEISEWSVTHHLDRDEWNAVRKEKKLNSSFGKVDIVVYPQFSLKNVIITQVYQCLFQLTPAVEFSLWPGSKFSLQVKIPVFNDGFGSLESKVHPGMLTFSQRFRLPLDINGRLSLGVFANNSYGAGLELDKRLSFAPWLTLEGSASMLRQCWFDGFEFQKDGSFQPFWSVGANAYWPYLETEFRGKVEKFLASDYGAKMEMIRHFKYCSIGFYLEKGFNDGSKLNGGFRFQIALPPYGYRRHGYIPRVTTSNQMGMAYSAIANTNGMYKEHRFEASDNIMSSNSFNPYYVEKEIKKLTKLCR